MGSIGPLISAIFPALGSLEGLDSLPGLFLGSLEGIFG